MQGNEILQPLIAMILVTLVVWTALYVRRIRFLKAHRIHAQKVSTPEKVAAIIPEHVQNPANNFKNLFELPVLFYIVMHRFAIYMAGAAALWFMVLRAAWQAF